MSNDKIIGAVMAAVSVLVIIVEFIYLIYVPLTDSTSDFVGSGVYWALALPLFLGVAGVLLITTWIGVTLIRTPPPEAWDFEDLEEEDATAVEEEE